MRGPGDEADSNFLQLMRLQSEDDKRITIWFEKNTNKYTAHDMQNEILKVMALQVLRQVSELLHDASFVTIMVDETTDISNKEQVVIWLIINMKNLLASILLSLLNQMYW